MKRYPLTRLPEKHQNQQIKKTIKLDQQGISTDSLTQNPQKHQNYDNRPNQNQRVIGKYPSQIAWRNAPIQSNAIKTRLVNKNPLLGFK